MQTIRQYVNCQVCNVVATKGHADQVCDNNDYQKGWLTLSMSICRH